MNFKKIILASASPRRKELLGLIFNEFEIMPSNVEEIVPPEILPQNTAEFLAKLKALDIAKDNPQALVLGADTCVICDDQILGKPKNYDDAFRMLKMLSGKLHTVVTGCALILGKKIHSFSVTTKVKFYELSDSQIDAYIKTGDCFDKAGAYGIQTNGALLVEKIDGDYFTVVGLPVARLAREIENI